MQRYGQNVCVHLSCRMSPSWYIRWPSSSFLIVTRRRLLCLCVCRTHSSSMFRCRDSRPTEPQRTMKKPNPRHRIRPATASDTVRNRYRLVDDDVRWQASVHESWVHRRTNGLYRNVIYDTASKKKQTAIHGNVCPPQQNKFADNNITVYIS